MKKLSIVLSDAGKIQMMNALTKMPDEWWATFVSFEFSKNDEKKHPWCFELITTDTYSIFTLGKRFEKEGYI